MPRLEGTDPDGAGINEQKVNDEGQALTFSIQQTELEHESIKNGAAYNWSTDLVNIASDATVLLVKNTSDKKLIIDRIEIANGSTESEFTVHLPTTEVTPTGTALTGTNLNTSSSNVADALAKSDETNNTQGNVISTVFLKTDTNINVEAPGLILGKNKSLGIDVVETTTEVACSIIGHYED